jgi:hypothetical protein
MKNISKSGNCYKHFWDILVDIFKYIKNTLKPKSFTQIFDELYYKYCEWQSYINIVHDYYINDQFVKYRRPTKGYYSSIAFGSA